MEVGLFWRLAQFLTEVPFLLHVLCKSRLLLDTRVIPLTSEDDLAVIYNKRASIMAKWVCHRFNRSARPRHWFRGVDKPGTQYPTAKASHRHMNMLFSDKEGHVQGLRDASRDLDGSEMARRVDRVVVRLTRCCKYLSRQSTYNMRLGWTNKKRTTGSCPFTFAQNTKFRCLLNRERRSTLLSISFSYTYTRSFLCS